MSSTNPLLGAPIKRKEDLRILLGKGEYIGNIKLSNMHYGVFLRSPYAHALIKSIDVADAKKQKGVVDVITGEELQKRMPPMILEDFVPRLWLLNPEVKFNIPKYYPLALGKVRYFGEPLALVIAKDPYLATDALELIQVDYEPLPVIVDAEEALKEKAPKLYDHWDSNVEYYEKKNFGDPDKAFSNADYIFSEKFYTHRCGGSPMETRGCISSYDPISGLTVWITTQRPFQWRDAFSKILNLPPERIRVIAPNDIGGSFGTKASIYSEELVIAYAGLKIQKPVKWIESRTENLTTSTQAREESHYLQIALTKDGIITGLKDKIIANVGPGYGGVYLGMLMTWLGAYLIHNAYKIPNIGIEVICAVTNKGPLQPSRAFGSMPPRFALERLLDIAAKEMKMDRVELRLKNLIDNFPYTSPTGIFHDAGDYIGAFKKCVRILDYEKFKREQEELRKQGRYIGIGIVPAIEIGGLSSGLQVLLESIPTYGVAHIRIDWDGKVTVSVPDVSTGTGHETILSQIVAGEIGVKIDEVKVIKGDTALCPYGQGWYAQPARNASAAIIAARRIKEKLAKLAAHLMKIDAKMEDFTFSDGFVIYNKDKSKKMSIYELAKVAILDPTKLPNGMEPGLESIAYHDLKVPTLFSIDVHGVIAEVSPNTGKIKIHRYVVVDDSGKPINELLLKGQIQGGMSLGVSNALSEEFVYDENGILQNPTLMDYGFINIAEAPKIEIYEHHVPTPYTATGGKGKGEGLPMGVPAAIANAVEDALSPFSVRITELPLSPEKIWKVIHK
ncbi:MAG: xanthine dehydrogenase family protein molybdopterin-binding subunit [Nitrososphaerales archaeon]